MKKAASSFLMAMMFASVFASPGSFVPPLASEAAAQERRTANPRHPANPRGVRDPRGIADPRGVRDPRGVYDPRGPYDPRNPRYNRYDAWQDARNHYYTRSVRVGAYYATRPIYSSTVIVSGRTYYYSGGYYYVRSGAGYVVAAPPRGAVVHAVPRTTTVVYVGPKPYYYYGGSFYVATTLPASRPSAEENAVDTGPKTSSSNADTNIVEPTPPDSQPMTDDEQNYQLVDAPVGASVPYLPEDAVETTVNGKTYFVYDDVYYQAFSSEDETVYMVVDQPSATTSSDADPSIGPRRACETVVGRRYLRGRLEP